MKRIFTLASLVLTLSASGFAQGEMDAFNLSYNDLTGTARGVAMGGAFGALGGDATGVAINPAGIGVYSSSEIVTTLNFTNKKAETNFLGTKADDSKFKFNFDNISIVGAFPLNSDEVPLINFGFAYNNLKSFDRKISMRGNQNPYSLSRYVSDLANIVGSGNIIPKNAYDISGDWLPILGYDGGLAVYDESKDIFSPSVNNGEKVNSNLYMHEKGYISSYDFSLGTTISDMLSIGATVSVTDIDYHLSSTYSEDFYESGQDREGFDLRNGLSTEGAGWQVKAGLIFKPVNELRIGVAYHSPTWYNMTDYYYGEVEYKYYTDKGIDEGLVYTPDGVVDYKFRTPDKWVFSLAGVIGKYAIISADYELTNYSKMNLQDRDGDDFDFQGANSYIKEDFKNASTLRIGAEVRITPQFSARVGYMWQQSPLEKSFKDGEVPVATVGTIPHYTLVGDANHFTWGLGYKFKPITGTKSYFYTDVAFVIKNRTDDLYTYSKTYDESQLIVDNKPAELKINQFTGLLSLGYRF